MSNDFTAVIARLEGRTAMHELTMTDVIDFMDAATEPSEELDTLLYYKMVLDPKLDAGMDVLKAINHPTGGPTYYTNRIDSARRLIVPGVKLMLGEILVEEGVWRATLSHREDENSRWNHLWQESNYPALAICKAAARWMWNAGE